MTLTWPMNVKHESHLIRAFELFVPDILVPTAYFIVMSACFRLPRETPEGAEESISRCPAYLPVNAV